MKLYLLRHGIAEDPLPGQSDSERSLTKEGRRKMSEAANGLRLVIDEQELIILSSPYKRAQETAAIVRNFLSGPAVESVDFLFPHSSVQETLDSLKPWHQLNALMLVGHNPHLSELTGTLTSGSSSGIELKKGALVALDCPDGPFARSCSLKAILPSRALREMGS